MRIALCVEYNGTNYSGWQRQEGTLCAQECVENALEKIALTPIKVTCAGRTDAGVHATYQIIHFDTDVQRPIKAWTRGMNTHLPHDIAIKWAEFVADDFHARFSATARRYRYVIYNDPLRPGIMNGGLTHIYYPLNAELMHQAAQCLAGTHDFTSFRAANCQAKTAVRTIHHIQVTRQGRYIIMDVKANAFLHHMVRNIIGSLVVVGRELEPVAWFKSVLEQKDRKKAGITARPNGLYLIEVDYPAEFSLPASELGPVFMDNSFDR